MTEYHLQYADKNFGPANYSRQDDRVLVHSLFNTIQGEGPFAGYPAIFLRLAGCNRGVKVGMGCEFCDTDFRYEKGEWWTPEMILASIRAFEAKTNLIVITGGEPMIQAGLGSLLRKLLDAKYRIQIESNGDRLIADWDQLSPRYNLFLVVSPKVSMHEGKYSYTGPRPLVIAAASAFKFLIDADPASPYFSLPDYLKTFSPFSIYLSPIAVYKRAVVPGEIASAWDHTLIDPQRTAANYRYAAELAMAEGYLLSCQTHLFLGAE